MTAYTAHFRTDVSFATLELEADTPELALENARKFAVDKDLYLSFEDYDKGDRIIEIEICDEVLTDLAIWRDDDYRLRLAAQDLLEASQLVMDRWERGDLAEAVRGLAAAITKATGGAQ